MIHIPMIAEEEGWALPSLFPQLPSVMESPMNNILCPAVQRLPPPINRKNNQTKNFIVK
jgi:hypothetical protein